MFTHYFTLAALAGELRPRLSGSVIGEVFTQQKDELIISVMGAESRSLAVSVMPRFTYVMLRDQVARARRNSVDLFPEIVGKEILGVDVPSGERTMRLSLAGDRRLLLRLYGTAESNVLLADAQGSILQAFKSNKRLQGSVLPDSGRNADFRILEDADRFSNAFLSTGDSLLTKIKGLFPVLGSLYAREALYRAGLPETSSQQPDEEGISRLRAALRAIFGEADHPGAAVYGEEGEMPIVTVIPLHQSPFREARHFAAVNEALLHAVVLGARHRRAQEEKNELQENIRKELRRLQRASERADEGGKERDETGRYRMSGNIILAHLRELTKGMRQADLREPATGDIKRIALDPALTPAQNAERYFEMARKREADRDRSGGRRAEMLRRLESLRRLDAALSACRTGADLRNFRKEFETEIQDVLPEGEGGPGSLPPFRVFRVAGELEVWVGKNSANNDLLTMKYARPHDLWFHVRGAGGSHTVLRVPRGRQAARESVIAAAAIAAYYSKMRKAGTVPVAYCERKFVRKRRNSPEGEVTLEREEVVFVRPHLP